MINGLELYSESYRRMVAEEREITPDILNELIVVGIVLFVPTSQIDLAESARNSIPTRAISNRISPLVHTKRTYLLRDTKGHEILFLYPRVAGFKINPSNRSMFRNNIL